MLELAAGRCVPDFTSLLFAPAVPPRGGGSNGRRLTGGAGQPQRRDPLDLRSFACGLLRADARPPPGGGARWSSVQEYLESCAASAAVSPTSPGAGGPGPSRELAARIPFPAALRGEGGAPPPVAAGGGASGIAGEPAAAEEAANKGWMFLECLSVIATAHAAAAQQQAGAAAVAAQQAYGQYPPPMMVSAAGAGPYAPHAAYHQPMLWQPPPQPQWQPPPHAHPHPQPQGPHGPGGHAHPGPRGSAGQAVPGGGGGGGAARRPWPLTKGRRAAPEPRRRRASAGIAGRLVTGRRQSANRSGVDVRGGCGGLDCGPGRGLRRRGFAAGTTTAACHGTAGGVDSSVNRECGPGPGPGARRSQVTDPAASGGRQRSGRVSAGATVCRAGPGRCGWSGCWRWWPRAATSPSTPSCGS